MIIKRKSADNSSYSKYFPEFKGKVNGKQCAIPPDTDYYFLETICINCVQEKGEVPDYELCRRREDGVYLCKKCSGSSWYTKPANAKFH